MDINCILKKFTRTGTIYKTAATWQEMEELGKEGFGIFSRKEYELIRAMGLNDDLFREIVSIRKKIGLPERGFSAKEFIAISSDPKKTLDVIFNTEARFNKLIGDIHAGYVIAPEVSCQLYNLVLCNHAIPSLNTPVVYFASNGASPMEVDKNHVVIAISKKTTINTLHNFLDDNAEEIEGMLNKLYYEGPTISERDLRIYELRKTTDKTFVEIAEQIIQEFNLDDPNAEMNCGSARTASLRVGAHMAKLFSPRNRT